MSGLVAGHRFFTIRRIRNSRLVAVLTGIFSPLSVFLLVRSMQRIPRELGEAAALAVLVGGSISAGGRRR